MTTFTDKEMIKEIKERIGSLDVRDNIERRAYEIALASLEAEPAGKLHEYKPVGYQRLVDELTMLVKRLAWQLKKAKPGCKLPDKAMDYLERNGLISVEDVLR
ncbi:hypothetical protein M8567_004418 [Escherichia coli]|uniref:hypothetical protein n=3 Tax=Escherichia coli TaxID=562 RepID=UPI00028ECC21|nr:hypothetical protein [Escherichia coli]EFC1702787.1 hypothetical protein [Escherichia coli]EFL9510319.1 hypothetical protein [Escherichia coli]EFL9664461.1 hypothetical protein [Escherichia coli]EIR6450667.1 hypothetical protein [Escherichia coli]EIR6563441.1 hypothetical protein [Escherichia coli]